MSKMKSTQEGHGIVNKLALRLFTVLGNRSLEGKHVVVAAHESDSPIKWGGEYAIGPKFSGKQVGEEFAGYFDRIGYVQDRFKLKNGEYEKDKLGHKIKEFPPIVRFQSDGSFIARGGGVCLLDWGKILGTNNGGNKK